MSEGGTWPQRFALKAQPLHSPLVLLLTVEIVVLVAAFGWMFVRFARLGVWPPVGVWASFVLTLPSLVPLASFVLQRRRGTEALEVTPEWVRVPSLWAPRRLRQRPLSELRSALVIQDVWSKRVFVGFERGFPVSIACKDFVEPDGAERFVAAVRRAAAQHRDAGALLPSLDGHRTLRAALGRRLPLFSIGLVAVLALVFAIEWAAGVTTAERGEIVVRHLGASVPSLVRAGEWQRLFTANLLHGNLLHLLANSFTIAVLGLLLERQVGTPRTVLIGLGSGIAGAAASAATGRAEASLGASTIAMGLWAAWLLLVWRRREQLPHRPATWTIVLPLLVAPIGELVAPNIDHWGHLGGAVGGALAMALLLRGRDLHVFAAPAPALRPWAAGAVALYAIALATLLFDTRPWSAAGRLDWTDRTLAKDGIDAQTRNALAWDAATSPEAAPALLALARDRLRTTPVPRGSAASYLDTRALLAHRIGDRDEAVFLQSLAYDAADEREYAARLGHYQWARHRETGAALRIGTVPDRVAIALDAAREDEEGEQVMVVEIGERPRHVLEVDAVALSGDDVRGHLRLRVGPAVETPLRFADADSPHNQWRDVRFEVTRLDGTRDEPSGDHWWWRLRRAAPEDLPIR